MKRIENKIIIGLLLMCAISCQTGPSFNDRIDHANHCLDKQLDSLNRLIDSNELITKGKRGLEWVDQEQVSQKFRIQIMELHLRVIDSIKNVK